MYRRRAPGLGGLTHTRVRASKVEIIDNQWIAPYNHWFTYKYNCHFFFEACNDIRSVKYIYKHVYKGRDRATIKLENEDVCIDESSKYEDSRYLSSSEYF